MRGSVYYITIKKEMNIQWFVARKEEQVVFFYTTKIDFTTLIVYAYTLSIYYKIQVGV